MVLPKINSVANLVVIAIDGFSSCGKSTFAKAIANELNFTYIDSGAMYRAVTLFAIRKGLAGKDFVDEDKLISALNPIKIDFIKNEVSGKAETFLNGENVEEDIRGIDVSQTVSLISVIKPVRLKMVEQQRLMSTGKSVVMDGRDIGTTVFPNADLKIFMTADTEIRAKRRFDELIAKGLKVNIDEIKRNIEERDYLDTTRKESPLKKAPDSVVLDNSHMTPGEQMVWFKKLLTDKKIIKG